MQLTEEGNFNTVGSELSRRFWTFWRSCQLKKKKRETSKLKKINLRTEQVLLAEQTLGSSGVIAQD